MYIRHREAAAAATDDPENIQQMDDLRILCLEYDPNDILNIDETGLF
jgi:DDE superfamily endonuclease